MEDSNPQRQFWRLLCFHYTNGLCPGRRNSVPRMTVLLDSVPPVSFHLVLRRGVAEWAARDSNPQRLPRLGYSQVPSPGLDSYPWSQGKDSHLQPPSFREGRSEIGVPRHVQC